MSTPCHSRYWVHAQTLKGSGGNIELLSRSIANARIEVKIEHYARDLSNILTAEKEGH